MDELIASYRISVRLYSKMKYIQHAVLVCWYCLAVYFWPYFIPLIIKSILIVSALIFCFLCFYPAKVMEQKLMKHNSQDQDEVFQLSELGQVYWVKSARSGQLLATSYFWPFCFYLRIINPISQKYYWKVIFVDQVSDDSVRRLRRKIKRIKAT
jgi:glucan phosphoethanolaminetransferase (alkaline phosphatase superfamily)